MGPREHDETFTRSWPAASSWRPPAEHEVTIELSSPDVPVIDPRIREIFDETIEEYPYEHAEEEGVRGSDILDRRTGHPRLLSRQCSTCVGRPGNLMHLRPGRLKDLIAENTGPEALGLVCHETLPYGDYPDFGPALCRWFYDNYGHLANGTRIFGRLCGFTEVDPPGEEDDGDAGTSADAGPAGADPQGDRPAAPG
jgi:hypothetical protein